MTARRLFETDGYGATTIEAIAAEVGVSSKTVYLAFTTKPGLLRAVWDLALKGDEAPDAVDARPWRIALLAEPDGEKKLRALARESVKVKQRIAPILRVIRSAGDTDDDLAALGQLIDSDFWANQRAIVESLHETRSLRRGLSVDRGADILWTLNHPDQWLLLVGQRGWTPAEFERWLADSACFHLLRPAK